MKKKKIFKKKLEDFLKDESGNISRDKVLKIGLGTISALGIMAAFTSDMQAGHSDHTSHSNGFDDPPGTVSEYPRSGGDSCVSSHFNSSPHTSHSSY